MQFQMSRKCVEPGEIGDVNEVFGAEAEFKSRTIFGLGRCFDGHPDPQRQHDDHGDDDANGDGDLPIGYSFLHDRLHANVMPRRHPFIFRPRARPADRRCSFLNIKWRNSYKFCPFLPQVTCRGSKRLMKAFFSP